MSDNIHVISKDELTFLGKTYHCAIGSAGFTSNPKEGDKKTPLGIFALRECWYRADKIAAPHTALPLQVIHNDDGWCDEPKNPEYNKHVKLPFAASHEVLMREDENYDIIVPIGFNDGPIIPGLGSAIFFHIAKPDYTPTLGCVAVSLSDMIEILANIKADTQIIIAPTA